MTMVVECIAVVVIILLFASLSWRRGARHAAKLALPLVTVPVFHIALTPFSGLIASAFSSVGSNLMAVFMDILGLVVACALLGVFAVSIPGARGRRSYLWLTCGFSFILTLVLVHSILGPLSSL